MSRYMRCPSCNSGSIVVTARLHNRSAFGGYRIQVSVYSELRCLNCWRRWRSKSPAVAALPDADDDLEYRRLRNRGGP